MKEKELFRFLYLQQRQPSQDLLDDLNWEMLICLLSKTLILFSVIQIPSEIQIVDRFDQKPGLTNRRESGGRSQRR